MVCLWAMIAVSISFIIHFGLFSKPPLSWLLLGLSRFDLVLHTIAFTSLAIPAFMLFGSMFRTAVSIFALGAGLELAQWMTMSREASIPDLAANGLGIACAAFIVTMLKRADFAVLRPVLIPKEVVIDTFDGVKSGHSGRRGA